MMLVMMLIITMVWTGTDTGILTASPNIPTALGIEGPQISASSIPTWYRGGEISTVDVRSRGYLGNLNNVTKKIVN